jgi:hypothetical protein
VGGEGGGGGAAAGRGEQQRQWAAAGGEQQLAGAAADAGPGAKKSPRVQAAHAAAGRPGPHPARPNTALPAAARCRTSWPARSRRRDRRRRRLGRAPAPACPAPLPPSTHRRWYAPPQPLPTLENLRRSILGGVRAGRSLAWPPAGRGRTPRQRPGQGRARPGTASEDHPPRRVTPRRRTTFTL